MFEKKAQKGTEALGMTNRIVEGTAIQGNIVATADTRIDGTLEGNFQTKGKLVIGPAGSIKGNIVCKNCDIEGGYEGKIQVAEVLNLKATAKIKADIVCGKLSVEPGAVVNGTCVMTNASQHGTVAEKTK